MKLDEKTAKLICDLEYIVGSECYNPKSYNGWTGDVGCAFRYPVYFCKNEGDEELAKERHRVEYDKSDVPTYVVDTMKYKFGSNHLFIGDALVGVLNELEKLYGIDFNELEKQRRKLSNLK